MPTLFRELHDPSSRHLRNSVTSFSCFSGEYQPLNAVTVKAATRVSAQVPRFVAFAQEPHPMRPTAA